MPVRRPLAAAIWLLGGTACATDSAKLPGARSFSDGSSHADDSAIPSPTDSAVDSGLPTCAVEECPGCCDETDACIEPLEDSACAGPGATCRDCTTDDRTCAEDAMCINPVRLDGGQVDDRALKLSSVAGALQTRSDLLMRIFGEPALPSIAPGRLESGVADPFGVADDTVHVERVEVDLPGGTTTPFWVLTPDTPSGQLVVVHQGHWHTLREGRLETVAEDALSRGAVVVGLTMPLYGESTGPVPTHDDLIAHFPDDLPGHGTQVFLAPVATAIDLVTARHSIEHIAMVGISGGGWTTVVYAALDPRVDLSIPISGSEPLYQRTDLDWGDREQSDNHLYEVAGYLDLHLLSTLEAGRQQHPVVHRYDTCCFAGTGYQAWEPTVQAALETWSGGSFSVFLDESFRGHEVSPFALEAHISPLLSGDAVRVFDDTLPAYGAFSTEGTWERDASSGFGNDAARGEDGQASWTIDLPAGDWSAALTWVGSPELSGAVPVVVSVDGVDEHLVVDQTTDPEGAWQVVGSGTATGSEQLRVTLEVPAGGQVRADALRVEAPWSP